MTTNQDSGGGTAQAQARIAILLIDDDIELCELMQRFFTRRGMDLEVVHDGRRGLARALGGGHDLLLLDVMMPGLDGFELLRLLRRQSQVPVIVLTARTAEGDRITGLDAGADDYLPKPFGPDELRRAAQDQPASQQWRDDRSRWNQAHHQGSRGRLRGICPCRHHGRVRHPGIPGPRRGPDRLAR